ncbi:MAG: hypothetical protein HFJ53_03055 [Clostridia bacterium]|nr:hypothetical protein [Clostridia bacterium]
MKKFQIEIEEISQRVEDIEANNLEEALEKVEDKYNAGEIVLDYEDFKDHEVREYRNCVREEDLVRDAIIDINFGQAIILEKEKDWALIKKLGVEESPYVVTNGLGVHKSKTYFDWLQGSYYTSLTEASKVFEERTGINKNLNDIIFNDLGEKTLENHNVLKFENIDTLFDYLMDDEINKEDLVNMLSEEMKREIAIGYVDSVREENGNFYYGSDMCFFEEDINWMTKKIDEILNGINIKNIKPYIVIEVLEQYDNGEIDKDFSVKIENLIHAAGYKKTAVDFVKFINEELYKEEPEESEENEEEQ